MHLLRSRNCLCRWRNIRALQNVHHLHRRGLNARECVEQRPSAATVRGTYQGLQRCRSGMLRQHLLCLVERWDQSLKIVIQQF